MSFHFFRYRRIFYSLFSLVGLRFRYKRKQRALLKFLRRFFLFRYFYLFFSFLIFCGVELVRTFYFYRRFLRFRSLLVRRGNLLVYHIYVLFI
mgnify:CR=1 FL=1